VAFTKDQDIMDASLVDTLHYLGIYGLIMLATVITVSITIPMFSIFAGVLFIVTFIMLYFYLPVATKLKKHKVETGGEHCYPRQQCGIGTITIHKLLSIHSYNLNEELPA
jgi:hypothetical protein